jgi:hypothetical protein
MVMSAERQVKGWRRWRDVGLAVCTAWLVVQNLVLVALVVWAGPAHALAAGTALAQTALRVGGQLVVLGLATVMALALAAWLVHAPDPRDGAEHAEREVGDGW